MLVSKTKRTHPKAGLLVEAGAKAEADATMVATTMIFMFLLLCTLREGERPLVFSFIQSS
jgi:hypothetical protein